MGVVQAERLGALLRDHGLPWNARWEGRALVAQPDWPQSFEMPGGLLVTPLAPTHANLRALEKRWDEEASKTGIEPGEELRVGQRDVSSRDVGEEVDRGFEGGDETPLAPARSSGDNGQSVSDDDGDFGERPDIERLADEIRPDDRSVTNLASIALLVEFADRAALFGGDARGDHLAESISALLALRGQQRLVLDAFVVPHAGSRHNLSRELLALLDCRMYMISTDGRRFGHPDQAAVAAIIRHGRPSTETLTLAFNHRTSLNAVWASPELQKEYGYEAIYGDEGLRVDFAGVTDLSGSDSRYDPQPES